MSKTILFTVFVLDGFHGSVVHIKEWASYLVDKGYEIVVATVNCTRQIENVFAKKNIKIKKIAEIKDSFFDIIFSFHYPIIGYLLKYGVNCRKLVFWSLSGLNRLEAFPSFWPAANYLIVMSQKTKKLFHEKYAIPLDQIHVIDNVIPQEYFDYTIPQKTQIKPKRIAVVSNHIPDEINKLKKYLKNIKINYIGLEGNIYKEVTPALLAPYDIIISIGKTVQYALGLGIPVYEYDQFGGCGYITPQNYEDEKNNTFCGMLTERKLQPQQIVQELIDGYQEAKKHTQELKNLAYNDFLLTTKAEKLLSDLNETDDFNRENLNKLPFNTLLEMDHNEAFCSLTREIYIRTDWKIVKKLERYRILFVKKLKALHLKK